MSDREAIVQALRQIESSLRTNRLVRRLASGSLVLILIAILVKVWDLFLPFSSSTITVFWLLWFSATAAFVARTFVGSKKPLSQTAAEVDQKAHLHNELTSAYWFTKQESKTPWVALQVHRAARTAQRLDPTQLYPRAIPPTSYFVVGLGFLLLILNFAPLPLDHKWLYSREAPVLTMSGEDEALLAEIEELIEQAQALEDTKTIEQLKELFDGLRSGELSAGEALDKLGQIQDLMEEGNLSMASIIEGLEDIGRDLQRSEDTLIVGETMSRGELQQAAKELRRLAEELGRGQEPAEDLQETLNQAAENTRPGLEELTEKLQEASDHLQDQEALQRTLEEASQELEELSEMVESQQIKNQASQQLENLQNSLREQQSQERQIQMQMALDELEGQAQQQIGNQGQQQQAGQEGQLNSEPEYAPGTGGEGQMADQAQPPGQASEMQGLDATGTGQIPSGFGFSPEKKEGAPTGLDVQLHEEYTEAQRSQDIESEAKKIEKASPAQRSKRDYRNVQSNLTPVHQDLLNQEQIPRQYRNLIKAYFQAIRPRPTP